MSLTSHRVLQWLGIILIVGVFAGAYWYFQVRASTTQKSPNNLGLVGYWPMDEGSGTVASDHSGNGNTGTLVSGPTWVTGKLGQALSFNGTNQKVQTLTEASPANTNRTICAWVNTSSTAREGVVTSRPSSTGWALTINRITPGNLTYINDSSFIEVAGGITTNKWFHICASYVSSTRAVTLYTNGVSLGGGIIGAIDTATSYTLIGYDGFGYFAGVIDDARVYNRVLSATEIAYLYNSGSARLNTSQNNSITNGLVGLWSFNGADISGTTAYDRSGSGNNGTLTNGPLPTSGKLGQALNFWPNGSDTNAYVTMGDPSSGALDFGSGDFSVGFWMKGQGYANQGSGVNAPISKQNSNTGTAAGYAFYYASTNLMRFAIGNGATAYATTQSVSTTADNQWHYYSGLRSGSTMYLYVDGIFISSAAVSGSTSNAIPFYVSAGGTVADRNINGSIDEVRVYNRALSAGEIQSLYDLGASDKVNSAVSQPQGTGRLDSGLAGYWKLDDGSGTSATDSSTNANTGTLTNGPTWGTGQIGGGVNFDGTDDYISTAGVILSTTDVSQPHTVSQWIKTSSLSTYNVFFSQYTCCGAGRFIFMTSSDGCVYYKKSWVNLTSSTKSVADNQWHHIVFVKTGNGAGQLQLYIDGVANGTPGTDNEVFQNAPVEIGRDSRVDSFTGSIDEVRIYNRALSADEVSQLYRLTTPTGVDTSLKGYWSFNGQDISGTTAYDRSGSGNNGTLTNGPTKVPGKLGQALSFDNVDDKVNAGTPSSLNITNTITVSAWIYPKSYGGGSKGRIMDKWGGSLGYWFAVDNSTATNGLLFGANVGNTGDGCYTSNVITLNQWQYVVATVDSNKLCSLYVNGALVGTPSTITNFPLSNAGTSMGIGGKVADNTRSFDGKIDEVRIYNRALGASEIAALYNQGR